MRIALVSTCAVAVPPKGYGGTELVTAELAKMLGRLGHEVTVFATGDSAPAGELVFRFARPVWPPDDQAELLHAAFAWRTIAERSGAFDVVHMHAAPSLPLCVGRRVPVVFTIHHARDERLLDVYRDFPEVAYVAISERQAALTPELTFAAVLHHGLDPDLYPLGRGAGGYCAFLGRLAEQKAPHLAIDAARMARVPLRIAGEPHWDNHDYFRREVLPRFARAHGAVDWLREVTHGPKVDLLCDARALLFPLAWEEPFGLAMIESMLVGTPVIAFNRGSVPEVVEEGITGFIVDDAPAMARRIGQLGVFDRQRCRARAQERWSSMRMAREHEAIYQRALRERRRPRPRPRVSGLCAVRAQVDGARESAPPLSGRGR
jgi:glycosyltransferase involved in cell wall biosynthesis